MLLKDDRVDLNVADCEDNTALIQAAKRGYVEVVRLLLNVPRVDADAIGGGGWTALTIAAYRGFTEVVNLF